MPFPKTRYSILRMKHSRINLSLSVELENVMSSIPIHSKKYWIQRYVYPFGIVKHFLSITLRTSVVFSSTSYTQH